MKKIYLLVAIFLCIFPLDSFAGKINNPSFLKVESTNSNPVLINKTNSLLVDPTTSPTASSTSICEGDNLTLTANPSGGVAPHTFSWTGPSGCVFTDEN